MGINHIVKDRIYLRDEYLQSHEDIMNVDSKHRVVIPSYYRDKTAFRLKSHGFSDDLSNRFALVLTDNCVSVLDTLAYQLAYKSIADSNLSVSEVEHDLTGRIIIPKNFYEELFNEVKAVSFKPSDDRMYFIMKPKD
jgi:DNA-binding transcriptional regulator/RsmH inhibitor MraZ